METTTEINGLDMQRLFGSEVGTKTVGEDPIETCGYWLGALAGYANMSWLSHGIRYCVAGPPGFFLYTPDLRHHYERMRAAGVEFLELPRAEPYGMGACGKVSTVTTCVGSWLPTEQPLGPSLRAQLCQLG